MIILIMNNGGNDGSDDEYNNDDINKQLNVSGRSQICYEPA